MSEELTKAQKDRQEVRAMLMRGVKALDLMEEQDRMDTAMGKPESAQSRAIMLLLPMSMLQVELSAFCRVFIAENEAAFKKPAHVEAS